MGLFKNIVYRVRLAIFAQYRVHIARILKKISLKPDPDNAFQCMVLKPDMQTWVDRYEIVKGCIESVNTKIMHVQTEFCQIAFQPPPPPPSIKQTDALWQVFFDGN